MNRPSRGLKWLYALTVFTLLLSGLAQMPIFKRYYIADIPGLGWLAKYYLTHQLHYVAATVFLALIGYAVVMHLGRWKESMRFTFWGHARNVIVAGIIVTGILRTLKNMPWVSFGPHMVMAIDWLHLGFVILLGVLALAALVARGKRYVMRG